MTDKQEAQDMIDESIRDRWLMALWPLKEWFEVMDTVGRGSDAHLFLAVQFKAMARVAAGLRTVYSGDDSTSSSGSALDTMVSGVAFYRQAELACGAAHFARYGRGLADDMALLRDLEGVRARLVAGTTVASRISALAWEWDRRLDPDNVQL